MLTITEEFLLLVLDTESGDIRSSLPRQSWDFVMAGAVLMDLSLANRIDTDFERLMLVDGTPLGDDLLDPTLADIATETEGGGERDAAFWLARIASGWSKIRRKVIDRLVDRGILETYASDVYFLSDPVSRTRFYPIEDGERTEEVQFRIIRTLYSEEIPDLRDILIISLATAGKVFEKILSRKELSEVQERIDQLVQLDLIGRELTKAVRQSGPSHDSQPAALQPIDSSTPTIIVTRDFQDIPQVSGWPLVGSAFDMSGDLRKFMAREYRKHGPIFRVRALNRQFITFAGPEAIVFLTQIMNTHLRSQEFWHNFIGATGVSQIIVSMDGSEHLRRRKIEARAYSPKYIEAKLNDFVDITRRAVAEWPQNRPVALQRAIQGIIAEQMGHSFIGISPRDHLDDLIVYLETLLKIHTVGVWPKQMKYWPRFRRARRCVTDLYAEILEANRPENLSEKTPDFVNALLELNQEEPQFFPETDFQSSFIEPYLVALDTAASTCSYMLYALLTHPDLLTQMRAEVDAAFARGPFSTKDIRGLDVTQRIILETLRMYPIAPALRRTVSNSFEFKGYKIPAGSHILIGTSVGHILPELFPNPECFDIERYRRSPPEHRKPGAFAPFGIGRHRCLGSSFVEVQVALTIATIIREVDLVIDKPDRPLKIKYIPIAQPHKSLCVRVTGRREKSVTTMS